MLEALGELERARRERRPAATQRHLEERARDAADVLGDERGVRDEREGVERGARHVRLHEHVHFARGGREVRAGSAGAGQRAHAQEAGGRLEALELLDLLLARLQRYEYESSTSMSAYSTSWSTI